ncbi:MAG: ribonuclease P protein subunit [Thermoplasmata archaeon]|nr:ribonuclease P protein subunit [Thermoplasmata archaeon]
MSAIHGRPRAPPLDPAFAGEILGAPLHVRHPGLVQGALDGVLIDETLNLLVVRVGPGDRVLKIPKAGASGTIVVGDRELPLNGESLRVRPEDRTKRAGARGRGR